MTVFFFINDDILGNCDTIKGNESHVGNIQF